MPTCSIRQPAPRPTPGRRLALALCAATALAWAHSAPVQAQDWPTKPVQIVVPFPAGGPLDLVARTVGDKMSARIGQPVVIDNRAGATGNIGAAAVARAAPDGHTVLLTLGTSLTANPAVYPQMAFNVLKDFAPVATLVRFSLLLAVHPSTGVKTWADFEKAMQDPAFNYGSAGAASPGHLAMAVLAHDMKRSPTHVPYRGNAPAVTGLVGGQVKSAFVALPGLLPHVKAGSLNALAVSGSKRSPMMPDIPTIGERGYPDSEVEMTFVLMAPAGTPDVLVQRLYREMRAALSDPEVIGRLAKVDIEPMVETPQQTTERLRKDTARWARVAKEAGIVAN